MPADPKYNHDEEHHNLEAPSIIVPVIQEIIKPNSVVDVGCGIGTFLHIFKYNGIDDILGLEGEWVNKDLLKKYIDLENFIVVDLEEELKIERRFDLAVCLEVAEHLKEESSEILVKNLVSLSDVILFSAAFPGQGGQNHLNEQWPLYWVSKFSDHRYICYDVIRPIFWYNNSIPAWYKQNMFLLLKEGNIKNKEILRGFSEYYDNKILSIVHPDYFNIHFQKSRLLDLLLIQNEELAKGKAKMGVYLKMIAKYFLRKVHLYNK